MRKRHLERAAVASLSAGLIIALGSSCTNSTNSSNSSNPETSAKPSPNDRTDKTWNYNTLLPGETEVNCPVKYDTGSLFGKSAEGSRYAFRATDAKGAPLIIGRLATVPFVPTVSGESPPHSWTFPSPSDQKRLYLYGNRDIPNINTSSGVYELGLATGADPSTYYIYCDHRSEAWPPPHVEPMGG